MQRLTVISISFLQLLIKTHTCMYTKYGNQMKNYLLHFGLIDKTIHIQNNL